MSDKRSVQKKTESFNLIIFNCFINSLISFVFYIIISFIINMLYADNTFISSNSKSVLLVAVTLSAVINGLLCAVRIKAKAIITSAISAVIGAVLFLVLFIILSDFNLGLNSLISIALFILTTVVSAIAFKNIIR